MKLKGKRLEGPSSEWNDGTLRISEQPNLNINSETPRNCSVIYETDSLAARSFFRCGHSYPTHLQLCSRLKGNCLPVRANLQFRS